jgi:uncharacterized protein YcnI
MSTTSPLALVSRAAVATAATTVLLLTAAGPAAAHVEVESEGARALAKDVTISFAAESESDSAGITKLEVVLPEGIDAEDVEYKDGPDGWKLKPSDDGYTVQGSELKVGENADHSISVRQLPDAKELAFKTLQSYGDGRTDRWIELPEKGKPEPEAPAPVLKLAASEPGASPENPSSGPSDGTDKKPSAETKSDQAAAAEEEGGLPASTWLILGAAVLAAIAAAAVLLMRRGAGSGSGSGSGE